MGIVFNNAIRNGGNMPKIQATTDYNSITGQLNSIALDTSSNTLYYWDPTVPEWIGLNGGGAPTLQNVLNTGNTASNVGPVITGANVTVIDASLFCYDDAINGAVIANAEGYEFKSTLSALSFWKIYKDPTTGNIFQKIYSAVTGNYTTLIPSDAGNIQISYPDTTGQMYNIVFASVVLIAGVGTYIVSGGSNSNILGIYVSSINTSTQIGVSYKWTKLANLITITALKSNGNIETSDISTLNISIAK